MKATAKKLSVPTLVERIEALEGEVESALDALAAERQTRRNPGWVDSAGHGQPRVRQEPVSRVSHRDEGPVNGKSASAFRARQHARQGRPPKGLAQQARAARARGP